MTDQPISPEVQELRDEQEAEKAHMAAARKNLEATQLAQAHLLQSQANLRNALTWLVNVAWIVGAVVVITQVIL
jgi:uncharacterized protein (DUF3084 family)